MWRCLGLVVVDDLAVRRQQDKDSTTRLVTACHIWAASHVEVHPSVCQGVRRPNGLVAAFHIGASAAQHSALQTSQGAHAQPCLSPGGACFRVCRAERPPPHTRTQNTLSLDGCWPLLLPCPCPAGNCRRVSQGGREAVPQWVELANGCLCCSVKAEFVQALEALLDADSSHSGKFDYVLVETTGESHSGQHQATCYVDCFWF